MSKITLRIGDLRRQKGVSQQVLADALGVVFQTISKWENDITMPDITMLPIIAEYFHVSVDQVLGLKPLPNEEYVPVLSGTKEYWGERLNYLLRTRKYMWNKEYMEFLVKYVWRITEPVDLLDCGCGWGFFASFLLPLLPEGSTYTGIDFNETLIDEAKRLHQAEQIRWIQADFTEYHSDRQYDIVLCQAVLRHIGKPKLFLDRMVTVCKNGGLVVCVDVNRQFESDGVYIEGMDYAYLCQKPGQDMMWKVEKEQEGRDFSIGMQLPEMMVRAGLLDVECRMNDKVNFITTQNQAYHTALQDLIESKGWDAEQTIDETAVIENLVNHGMTQAEAHLYLRKQRQIRDYIARNQEEISIVSVGGLMISYGRKAL